MDIDGDLDNLPEGFFDDLPGFGPLPGDGGVAGGATGGGFIADTVNNHGTIRPGGEGAPGPFNLTGDLVCHDTSVIQIELAGDAPIDEHDQLHVTGDVTLAGTLDVSLLDDFKPVVGAQFTIIAATGGTITGSFDFVSSPVTVDIEYGRSTVTLLVTAVPVPGDVNGDGVVDGADLGILLSAWGECVECAADLNGDGVVDGADLGMLLSAWTV